MKKAIALLLSLALSLPLVSCGSSGKPSGSGGGSGSAAAETVDTLNVGISKEPKTLDPQIHSNVSARFILQNLYRSLVNYQTDGTIGYEVADSHTVSEDNLTYTFHLRDGVTFHDGTPVTAEDVKYTFERIMDPANGATYRSYFDGVLESVNVVDERTVEFKLSEVCAPFYEYLSMPESAIVSKAWMEAGNDIATAENGCGPYTMKSWDKGLSIELAAYDGFYGEKAKTENVSFSFYSDETTRANALRTGEIDIMDYANANSVIQFDQESDFSVYSRQGAYMCLQINCNPDSPLSDPRVRQAIAYAIDRQAVIDAAFSGRGTVLNGFPSVAGQNGYNGELDNYFSLDLDKAKQLMSEAGYADGFTCTLLSTGDYAFHEQTALVAQDCLKKIGIECTVDLPDWATRMERANKGDYDLMVTGSIGKVTDMDWCRYNYYTGDVRMDSAPYFSDAKIDELLDLGRSTLDENERAKIYLELRERALELSPLVFICFRESAFITGNYVENFTFQSGSLSEQAGMCLSQIVVQKH